MAHRVARPEEASRRAQVRLRAYEGPTACRAGCSAARGCARLPLLLFALSLTTPWATENKKYGGKSRFGRGERQKYEREKAVAAELAAQKKIEAEGIKLDDQAFSGLSVVANKGALSELVVSRRLADLDFTIRSRSLLVCRRRASRCRSCSSRPRDPYGAFSRRRSLLRLDQAVAPGAAGREIPEACSSAQAEDPCGTRQGR